MSDAETNPVPVKGLFARAVGVIFSPRATFESVVAHPRPAGILLVAIVLTAAATAGPQFTERGRQIMLDMQVHQREVALNQTLSDDQYAQLERFSHYLGYLTIASVVIFTPVVVMFFSGLYWVLFNAVLGGDATFRKILAVVAHSSIISAVGAALGMPIMVAQGKFSSVGPFNLGGLAAAADPDGYLHHFLGAISVVQVWGIVATAIGLSVLYRRKVGGIATVLLGLYVVIVGTLAYFFGRFMA